MKEEESLILCTTSKLTPRQVYCTGEFVPQSLNLRLYYQLTISRLNGDYNSLHATPEPGKAMGFPGVISHGLIAWNMCAHAVVRCVGQSDGSSLLDFQARFAAPVLPGDQLCVEMWLHDDIEMKGGVVEVRFLCRVGEKIVLKAGRALIKRGLNVQAKI